MRDEWWMSLPTEPACYSPSETMWQVPLPPPYEVNSTRMMHTNVAKK